MKTKVIVVHRHERGNGSTILAVYRSNIQGHALAVTHAAEEAKSPSFTKADVVDQTEIEITEGMPLSKLDANTLRNVSEGNTPNAEGMKAASRLWERGLLDIQSEEGGIRITITPTGRAALAAYAEAAV